MTDLTPLTADELNMLERDFSSPNISQPYSRLIAMARLSLSPAVPERCVVPRDEDEWWEYYYLKEGWTTNDHD